MRYSLFIRRLIPVILWLCAALTPVSAQRNVFTLSAQPDFVQSSRYCFIYRVPDDSVDAIAFRRHPIDPTVGWMQRPACIVAAGKADSAVQSKGMPAGYYVSVQSVRNEMNIGLLHHAAFNISVIDLNEAYLLIATDSAGNSLSNATVTRAGKGIAFNGAMQGYLMYRYKDGDAVRLVWGGDEVHYRASVHENPAYRKPRPRNEESDYNKAEHIYNGYIVTNKPKYLPHDTVKWKAYLQLPTNRNEPVKEPLRINFTQYYDSKVYQLESAFEPQAPGVYYGEFVLGDSVKVDHDYTFEVYGTRSSYRLTQSFRVEDYLLGETRMRITGEGLEQYQAGDSVRLFAAATNANGLPVLDGELSITVMPQGYSTDVKAPVFIPDTLYHATVPVSPDGETPLGFTTRGFPVQLTGMKCSISLVNASFEHKDTSFSFTITSAPHYIHITQNDGKLRAELISGKTAISGKGEMTSYSAGGFSAERTVSFPFDYRITATDYSLRFRELNDTGGEVAANTFSINGAGLQGIDDFRGDTAILRIINPTGLHYRYAVYSGNDFRGYGETRGDTLLKVHSSKGRTVTIIGAYTWRGEGRQQRFTIYKMDRALSIDLNKKDLIYPGQRDTIGIRLSNKDGQGIGNTNVTVLAFSSQFATDNVPELPYGGLLYPGYTPHQSHDLSWIAAQAPEGSVATRSWLERCAADTQFFYKNLYLLPDDVAWLSYPIPTSVMPQAGVYLQSHHSHYQPEIIYVDNVPVYSKHAASADPGRFFIKEGVHELRIRTADADYRMSPFYACAGTKTDLYLNTDSVGPFYTYDTVGKRRHRKITTITRLNHLRTLVTKYKMGDSLDYYEKSTLASSMLLYRAERTSFYYNYQRVSYGGPLLYQYPLQLDLDRLNNGYNYNYGSDGNAVVAGPFDFRDSIGFYQPNNTRLRFFPERNYIFTFRPQMTRVEKVDAYTYFNYHFRNDTMWPAPGMVMSNPLPFDSLPVFHGDDPNAIYQRIGDPYTPINYRLISNTPPYDAAATAQLRIVSRDSMFDYYAVHAAGDTAQPAVLNSYLSARFRPGKAALAVLWRNQHLSRYDQILLRPNGVTLYPVSYAQQQGLISRANVPPWLSRNFAIDTNYYSHYTYYGQTPSGSGSAGITGTVADEKGEGIPGAAVIVQQGGINKIATLTDIDGRYEAKPLEPGNYEVLIRSAGYPEIIITGVTVTGGSLTKIDMREHAQSGKQLQSAVVTAYRKPIVDYRGSVSVRTGDEIDRMPNQSTEAVLALGPNVYAGGRGYTSDISIGGGRTSGNNIIIDGISYSASALGTTTLPPGAAGEIKTYSSGIPGQYGDASGGVFSLTDSHDNLDRTSAKSQAFFHSFLSNMMAASGLRSDFRDWAIWEPNLWTNSDGNASFSVTYPSNTTSWKTYVLAMNRKGYAGRIMQLTRAFKPLSAQLLAPRFLRYGDTAVGVGKVANYSGQPFHLTTNFAQDGTVVSGDTATVNNSRVSSLRIAAPTANTIDTAQLSVAFSITADNGYSDGEEKVLPVYPVGMLESKGDFQLLDGDTTTTSAPDENAGHFTGTARVYADGSLLEVMLHEVEALKEDPHGCNEQLTTKLLAIYYEEAIKKLLGRTDFNNTKVKRKILEKLIASQQRDGGFGWWSGNAADYRITNYIISTMQKVNGDGWLSVIINRGLTYLNSHVDEMNQSDRIATLSTLSTAGYAANYIPLLKKIDSTYLTSYERFALIKISREQKLPYRAGLDSMMKLRHATMNGSYWGNNYCRYDWYRDDLATTVMAYNVIKGDSIYGHFVPDITRYLLFRKQGYYYQSTATSGLVLTALLPELLAKGPVGNSKVKTNLRIEGSVTDSITAFPKMYEVKGKAPHFTFHKQGISPVYVSVVYDYFNINPMAHDSDFMVRTFFLNAKRDTVTALKAGEKITLRTVVTCKKASEYIMIQVPIPAGCIQGEKETNYYRYGEAARENFKDQTDIFCNRLEDGTYTFDVQLEARYKGSYNVSPARAGMMYFPEEFGNTEMKRVQVR